VAALGPVVAAVLQTTVGVEEVAVYFKGLQELYPELLTL
jgi:hypothetical protein